MNELDTYIKEAGGFSWYQVTLLLSCSVPLVLVGANMGASVFIAMVPDARCRNPSEEFVMQDCPYDFQTFLSPGSEIGPSTCRRYDYTGMNISLTYAVTVDTGGSISCNFSVVAELPGTVPCEEWAYDDSVMRNTIVTDFNLMCGDSWAGYFAQSALMLGVGLGSMLAGTLSDRLGRRHAFLFVCIGALTFGTALAFTQSYVTFCIVRTLFGFFAYSSFPVLFVLNSEMTTPRYRPLSCQLTETGFTIGYFYLSLVSYLLREWRKVQILLVAPFALGIPLWWFLPESPRWLCQEGKKEEAAKIIRQMAKVNRMRMDENQMFGKDSSELKPVSTNGHSETLVATETSARKNHSVFTAFKHQGIRWTSLKLFYAWFCISCVYYGLTLNAAELGKDPFVNMCLTSLAEVVANALIIPLVGVAGRRPTCCVAGILAGVMCILVAFVPAGMLPIAILGRLTITIGFGSIYIYTNEFFATPIRTSAITMCNAMARIGGVVSPLIAMSRVAVVELPYVLFGVLAITAGGLLVTLPETKGASLPQTLEEGERFVNKKHKPEVKDDKEADGIAG